MQSLALFLLAALAQANPVDHDNLNSRQSEVPPITISNLVVSGSGCPQGSVSTSISSDSTVSLQ